MSYYHPRGRCPVCGDALPDEANVLCDACIAYQLRTET